MISSHCLFFIVGPDYSRKSKGIFNVIFLKIPFSGCLFHCCINQVRLEKSTKQVISAQIKLALLTSYVGTRLYIPITCFKRSIK